MTRKIFRSGNSLVISLPPELLDELQLEEGSSVSVEIDRAARTIIIQPANRHLKGIDHQFIRQVDEFIDQYRTALEHLAE